MNKCFLQIAKGQVISAGLDKKIYAWDARMEKGKGYVFESLDSEVTSMSLSGLNMMVTMGASILMCDLRSPLKPFESKDSDLKTTIICGSASPHAKGIVTVFRIVVYHIQFIVAHRNIMPCVHTFYIFELDKHLKF